MLLTDQRGRAGDVLAPYEQQVLNHVHRQTAGLLTGVSGAGIEIAGLRLPRRWWRRFTKAVVADSRRQGLSKRRWDVLALGPPVITCAVGVHVVAIRPRRSGDRCRGLPAVAWRRPCRPHRHPARHPQVGEADQVASPATDRARPRTGCSLALGAGLDGTTGGSRGLGDGRQHASRALAYASALGLAERAPDELPVVPEDDRLAWSNATGEWHVVRVRYPFRPGYGRHPAAMLLVGLSSAPG